MALNGFTFKGVHSSSFFIVNRVNKSIAPSISEKLSNVPNRIGAYDFGSDIGVKNFDIEVTLIEQSSKDLAETIRDINEWLINTNELEELELDEDEGIKYKARLVGDSSISSLGPTGSATLSFLVPDPHGESEEIEAVPTGSPAVIEYGGNSNGFPILDFTLNRDVSSLNVVHRTPSGEQKTLTIGKNADANQDEVADDERTFWDQMSEITQWSEGGTVENGVAEGNFKNNDGNYAFLPEYYSDDNTYEPDPSSPRSSNYSGWHGPSIIRSLSSEISDFKADFRFDLVSNDAKQIGRAQLYLLDTNGAKVGSVTLVDFDPSTEHPRAIIKVGSKTILDYKSRYWNNFRGGIWIRRVGNRWDAQVYKLDQDTGVKHTRLFTRTRDGYYYDRDGEADANIAQVQVHAGSYMDYEPVNSLFMHDLKVYSLGSGVNKETEVPFIAFNGDVVKIDNSRSAVYVNGEAELGLLNPTSRFVSLEKGTNEIIYDDTKATLNVKYKERWL